MPLHSKLLKYIDEVGRCGSIRLAARNLHVSSTTINKRIIDFENELGTLIFQRNPNGVELTETGEILTKHIATTLSEADKTFSDIKKLIKTDTHSFNIACPASLNNLLVPIINEYYGEYKDSFLSFHAKDEVEALNQLKSHQVDLAIQFGIDPEPGIEAVLEKALPVYAVLTKEHPLANKKQVSFEDCSCYPLVLPDSSWRLRQSLDDIFLKLNKTPKILHSSNMTNITIAMVVNHQGIGIQDKVGFEIELEKGMIVCIPFIPEQQIYSTLRILKREDYAMDNQLVFLLEVIDRYLENHI